MANNKLFGIKSAYILLLALMVSALCLPAAVCAYAGEPFLNVKYTSTPAVVEGSSGTVTVTITETGGYDYATNVIVSLSTDQPCVSFGNQQTIPKLGVGGTESLTFPIYAEYPSQAGEYNGIITIAYKEYGAMDIGTYSHTIKSNFQYTVIEPKIEWQIVIPDIVAGYSGTATVTVSETSGLCSAQNVQINLVPHDKKGISFGDKQTIPELRPGESKTLTFPIYTTLDVVPGVHFCNVAVVRNNLMLVPQDYKYVVKPVSKVATSVSKTTSGKSPLSPITIIIACIVTAFVAVYTGSHREKK